MERRLLETHLEFIQELSKLMVTKAWDASGDIHLTTRTLDSLKVYIIRFNHIGQLI